MRIAVIGRTTAARSLLDVLVQQTEHDLLGALRPRCWSESIKDADLIIIALENGMQGDSVALCQRVREHCPTAVILVTHKGPTVDVIALLNAGSDDCIDFQDRTEGCSRLAASLRRMDRADALREHEQQAGMLSREGIQIDPQSRSVTVDGASVLLTRRQFDLLYYLAIRPGAVMTRGRLMREVWGIQNADEELKPELGRTVDTHVSLLRSKLGDRRWIETVRGVGFRFRERQSA